MKIVIAGAGDVGTHLAKLLSREEQDVILIDSDPAPLAIIDANYNLLTQRGKPASFTTMRKAGVDECDLFIAVTPDEDKNLLSCSMAKTLGARKTVARIDNYEFLRDQHRTYFNDLGIDALVYPEFLAAKEIVNSLRRNWVRNWFEIHGGKLVIVGVKIRDNARIVGMQLKQFAMVEHNFHVAAIRRKNETLIPRGDDHILSGDILYFSTTPSHLQELVELCGKVEHNIKKVLVMGGSRIAVCLAMIASDEFKIKLIETDKEKCYRLPEKCPDIEIIHGDARDVDILQEEGIGDTDAFVALSDSSEANILACLTAKEFGIKKSIAEVEDIQFIPTAENLNIGTVINKKLIASSRIFQILLDADETSSKCLALTDAEVAEIEVRPNSRITRGPVYTLQLPHDMTIAGLIRNGAGMAVKGDTTILPGDSVVVFCLSGALHKVERLFK